MFYRGKHRVEAEFTGGEILAIIAAMGVLMVASILGTVALWLRLIT